MLTPLSVVWLLSRLPTRCRPSVLVFHLTNTKQKEIRFTQKASAGFYRNLPAVQKEEDPRMKMMMRRMMKSSAVIGSHSFGNDQESGSMLPALAASTPFARKPIVRTSFYRRTGVFTA